MKTYKKMFAFGIIASIALFFSQAPSVFAAYNYNISVLSPTGGQKLVIGSRVSVDWSESSSNIAFGGYEVNIELDKSDGSCVSGLPCPILLNPPDMDITADGAPYSWLVGYDGHLRNIPAGSYFIKIVWDDSSLAPWGPTHAEGSSGVFTIVAPTPAPTPVKTATPAPTKTTTKTTTTTSNTKNTTISACTDDASVTSSDLPTTLNLAPGATKDFSVNVVNKGNTNWTDGTYYQLRNSASQNLLTPTYGHLPNAVAANGSVAWSFTVTAPQEPGTYPVNLQMVHYAKGVYVRSTGGTCAAPTADMPFGSTLASSIIVAAASPSASPIAAATSSNWFGNNLMFIGLGVLALIAIIILIVLALKRRPSGIAVPPSVPPVPMPPVPPAPQAPAAPVTPQNPEQPGQQ